MPGINFGMYVNGGLVVPSTNFDLNHSGMNIFGSIDTDDAESKRLLARDGASDVLEKASPLGMLWLIVLCPMCLVLAFAAWRLMSRAV